MTECYVVHALWNSEENPGSVINNAKKKKNKKQKTKSKKQVTSHCSNDSGAVSPLWPFRLLLPPNSILLGTHFPPGLS